MESVVVETYDNTTDSYGQVRKSTPTQRTIQMVLKVYAQTNQQDPRFVDATNVGLTQDKNLSTKDCIVRGNEKFNIMYVIPTPRFNIVFLKKVL